MQTSTTRYFFILLFILISGTTIGQSDPTTVEIQKNNICINYGLVHSRWIDEGYTDSKLLFRGTNSKLSLGYGRETNKHIFNFTLSGSTGNVKSASGDLPSDFHVIKISLEYLRNFTNYHFLGKENHFIAGAHLSSTNYATLDEPVINNIGLFSVHGLYLDLSNRMIIDPKQNITVSYLMPVVIYTNRILWNGGASRYTTKNLENIPKLVTENGDFSYFDISRNIQFRIDYTLKIGDQTDLVVKYRFVYITSTIEAPIHLYSNELRTGFKFKF